MVVAAVLRTGQGSLNGKTLHWPPNRMAMCPVMEFWVSNAPGWVGEWEPLPPGQSIEMVMHGYAFTEK